MTAEIKLAVIYEDKRAKLLLNVLKIKRWDALLQVFSCFYT